MRGEIIGVWKETWREIWKKLADHRDAPDDLFCELYRELVGAFEHPPDVTSLADIVDDPQQARESFRDTKVAAFRGEMAIVEFLERAHGEAIDLGGDPLANRYFLLIEKFLSKYSLRYDLRRPFTLHPTLPGIFAKLLLELKQFTSDDDHLHQLMQEFEDSLRDLRGDHAAGRIKTCLQKQFNLLEGIGRRFPGVTAQSLGDICNQVDSWPHATIKEAARKLYGFRSDYPGLGHAGNPDGVLREVEMRDLIAVTVLLSGLSPYLTNSINSDSVYEGD